MNYFESYQFLFRSPKWVANLLVCAIAPIVPIAGNMVVIGYHFEIIEALHLRGREKYPDFDFNRLLKYLVRGAWPFLVQLVVGLILMLVPIALLLICYFGLLISIAAAAPQKGGGSPAGSSSAPIVWALLLSASWLFLMLVSVLSQIVLVPMTLRAGLMQDFGAGFSWPFVRDFMGRTWGKTLLAGLFLVVTATPLMILGLLLCILPAYLAGAWVSLAEAYLHFELYEEYLKRGGMEIPLQVETAKPPGAAYEE
jgi:hypothetical protein